MDSNRSLVRGLIAGTSLALSILAAAAETGTAPGSRNAPGDFPLFLRVTPSSHISLCGRREKGAPTGLDVVHLVLRKSRVWIGQE